MLNLASHVCSQFSAVCPFKVYVDLLLGQSGGVQLPTFILVSFCFIISRKGLDAIIHCG